MSAFLVDDGHIDYLLTAVRHYDIKHAYIPAASGEGVEAVQIDLMDDTELGRMLLGTNLTSMIGRYEDRLDSAELAAVEAYTYRRWTGPMSPVQTLKACDCYDYQCCEYDGWKDSLAKDVVDRIRSRATDKLPGYDKAAWGITRSTVTTEGN